MKKLEFRLLDKEEIECRVQSVMKDNSGCILLLYKTARTDYNLLDEVVGTMNWKCDYKEIKGNLYCEISIYNNDLQQWISKSNCGVESNTEAEKGEASDSLKRAGFVWGIGRELYTAPFTYIKLTSDEFSNSKLKTTFRVKEIGYTNRTITKLIIEDNKGNIRFKYGVVENAEEKDFSNKNKQDIKQQTKTPKNAERTSDKPSVEDYTEAFKKAIPIEDRIIEEKVINNDSELPFEMEEKKTISMLEQLQDLIASKCQALNKNPIDCYNYYCKQFKVKSVDELDSTQLMKIANDLDEAIGRRKGVAND